jgi:hypothetical protein
MLIGGSDSPANKVINNNAFLAALILPDRRGFEN